jgi:hypothetical protein
MVGKGKVVKRKVGGWDPDNLVDAAKTGAISGALQAANPFSGHFLGNAKALAIQGAADGVAARLFGQSDQLANQYRSQIQQAIPNTAIGNAATQALYDADAGFKNIVQPILNSAVSMAQGSGKRKVTVKGKKDLTWLEFVKVYRSRSKHPNMTYVQALKDCGPLYKKGKEMVGGGLLQSLEDYLWQHFKNMGSAIMKRGIRGF